MNLGELKKLLQAHFTDGLVTIAGSGLSAASGLPTMGELASHLNAVLPSHLSGPLAGQWAPIGAKLTAGIDLETALKDVDADSALLGPVVDHTAALLAAREAEIAREVLAGKRHLPLSGLLKFLTFSSGRAVVITSNYDRLVELAAEMSGFGVDCAFVGYTYGSFDPKLSREALGLAAVAGTSKKAIKRIYRPHIVVYKPHGSLDWYQANGAGPVRSSLPIDAPRLMITPGISKYRKGYEVPFDHHRECANKAIDEASRFLVVGYGFNDDQLETHLRPQLERGKPGLIITKALTPKAQELTARCDTITALTCPAGKETGTVVTTKGKQHEFADVDFWMLDRLVTGALS